MRKGVNITNWNTVEFRMFRGTDATGFAFNSGGKLRIYKRPVAAHEISLKLNEDANVILGHTRMATQGDCKKNSNFRRALQCDIPEEYIDLMLDYGYTLEDVEDLCGIPGAIEMTVSEILCEYGYCDE